MNQIISQIGWVIFTLLIATLLNYTLIQYSPINPEDQFGGFHTIQTVYSLDSGSQKKTFLSGYLGLLTRYIQGDFGWSATYNNRVVNVLEKPLQTSGFITLTTLLLSYGLAFLITSFYIQCRPSIQKKLFIGFSFIQIFPKLLIALLMILIFVVGLGFDISLLGSDTQDLPSFLERAPTLILPIITLMIVYIPKIFLAFTSLLSKQENAQEIQFLKTRGYSSSYIFWQSQAPHLLSDMRWRFANDFVFLLFTYGLIVEIIFAIPGMGYMGYQAIITGDQDLYLAIFFLFTVINITLNYVMNTLCRRIKL